MRFQEGVVSQTRKEMAAGGVTPSPESHATDGPRKGEGRPVERIVLHRAQDKEPGGQDRCLPLRLWHVMRPAKPVKTKSIREHINHQSNRSKRNVLVLIGLELR